MFISHIGGILKGSSGSGRVSRQNDIIKWYTQERFGSNKDNGGTKMIKGSLFVSSVITSRVSGSINENIQKMNNA